MNAGYLFHTKPFDRTEMNKTEIINDLVLLVMSYSLLTLTDFVRDIPTKIQIGYFMISLTIFTMVLNMYLISVNVYK